MNPSELRTDFVGPDDPRAALRALEQRARRRFGQNFLTRRDIVAGMVRGAGVQAGAPVIEIGPGLGMLTREIVEAGASLTAVEVDRDLANWIRSGWPEVRLVEADATRVDWSAVVERPGTRVIANLPYNVGTHLVVDLLRFPQLFTSLTVMLQREVVERLLAEPGSDAYGSLSVYVATRARGEWLLDVPASAFHPQPKVDSAVVHLELRACPDIGGVAPEHFDRVVRAAFAQRRKTVANSLSTSFPRESVVPALDRAGIDPKRRAETLGVDAFQRLAVELASV
jgi:16S rRNA (adenine1518-N6/adenine1519-N6)-dimethyltransferase